MNYLQLQEKVRVWVTARNDITDQMIKDAINQEYIELATPFFFHRLRTQGQVTTTVGGSTVAVLGSAFGGSGVAAILRVKNDTTNNRIMLADDAFLLDMDETIEGEPEYWWTTGSPTGADGYTLNLWPVPQEAYVLKLWMILLPPLLVADADVPIYPLDWHRAIELGSASELCALFNMNERSQMLMNRKLSLISSRQESKTLQNRVRNAGARPVRTRLDHPSYRHGED